MNHKKRLSRHKMKIKIELPSKKEILARGIPVKVAREGELWSKKQLGKYANNQGIYIIHHGGSIKYVGRTDKPTQALIKYSQFGERLRREFHAKASQKRHIYKKLEQLEVPPHIKVSFFPLDKMREIILGENLHDRGRVAVLEQALIHVYKPKFQESEWKVD